MASSSSIFRELNMSVEAIKKREYRVIEKEKKRRNGFIEGYMRIKYPKQYHEANAMYEELSTRYPNKLDLTKSYYFQKWVMQFKKSENTMLIPHLPILMSVDLLNQSEVQQPEVQHQSEVQQPEAHHQSEVQQPEVHHQFEVQQPEAHHQSEVQQPEAHHQSEVQQPEVHHQFEVQQPEVQHQSEVQQPEAHHQSEVQQPEVHHQSEVHQPELQIPEVQENVEVETTTPLDLTAGLTLNEMAMAVEDLTKALQSDAELMDIIESFDLPDSVWDNELTIPNYIDEGELFW